MRAVGIIPARLDSSRLPRKLLLQVAGKAILQYTWEAACRANSLDEVIVATDSDEVASVVHRFGGACEMTRPDHASGTDRIAEVVSRRCANAELIVNIQGDEPEIDPASVDSLVRTLAKNPGAEMATLATPITNRKQLEDPSCTKVVCAADGRALYFSRSAIPHCRDQDPEELLGGDSPWLLHLGIYAYRREFLLQLTQCPPSRLERLEKLEQLRALEAGACIQVATIAHHAVGIDTPDDYAQFVERQKLRAA